MLSKKELDFIQNIDYPLIKRSAFDKIKTLFETTANNFMKQQNHVPPYTNAKISTGENYLGLPYMVADIPKLTSDKPHMHIRIVFWWGNYFAIQMFVNQSLFNCKKLILNLNRMPNWYVLINNDIWNNNIHDDCWVNCTHLSDETYITLNNLEIIKFCGLVDIENFNDLADALNCFYDAFKRLS